MVGAPAAADAVERAQRLPSLNVGLHVVTVNGRPVLPAERVRALVDANGEFPSNLLGAGIRYFFNPLARRQLKEEIRAQFDAFARTGLALDHVNAQNHMHVHPTILGIVLELGHDYGMRAVRVPYEPGNDPFIVPWLALMRRRIRAGGLVCNDYVFGMKDTGCMSAERVLRVLRGLPGGVSELYSHPEIGSAEFEALIDPEVVRLARGNGISTTSFTALARER
jgi:hopanoid biosynthesis associated protein HpnK